MKPQPVDATFKRVIGRSWPPSIQLGDGRTGRRSASNSEVSSGDQKTPSDVAVQREVALEDEIASFVGRVPGSEMPRYSWNKWNHNHVLLCVILGRWSLVDIPSAQELKRETAT